MDTPSIAGMALAASFVAMLVAMPTQAQEPTLFNDTGLDDTELPDVTELTEEQLGVVRQLYNNNIGVVPQIRDMLANERINFYIEGMGVVSIVNSNGMMQSIEAGEMDDATLNLHTDTDTLVGIMMGDIEPLDALKHGAISYEGVGFFNWLRFAVTDFVFRIAVALGLV